MHDDQQPGQIIIPHGSNEPPKPGADSPQSMPPAALPAPQAVLTPAAEALPPPPETSGQAAPDHSVSSPPVAGEPQLEEMASETPAQAGDWTFRQEDDPTTTAQRDEPLPEGLTWTASEFVAHDKSTRWYGALFLGGGVAAVLIYFLTKDKITTGIIIFALLVFGIFAARKPRSAQYALSAQGLQIGNKTYYLHDFKTFSIVDEGSAASIVFMPLKRFMPPLTIYVTADIEDKVVDFLSAYLPLSEHRADAVDSLLRRIRF
jgi:hypothetical protein